VRFGELKAGAVVDVRVDTGTIRATLVAAGEIGLELEAATLQTKGQVSMNVDLGRIFLPWPSVLMVRW